MTSSSAPESTPPKPTLGIVQPRRPSPRWLTGSRQGFLLAFLGGGAIVLGLVLPNWGPYGPAPSVWEEYHPPYNASFPCLTLGCALVRGAFQLLLLDPFTLIPWGLIAMLILLLSGSQLLRRRLDDLFAGLCAFLLVLFSGVTMCAEGALQGFVLWVAHGKVVGWNPTGTLLLAGPVLTLVGGIRAGRALD